MTEKRREAFRPKKTASLSEEAGSESSCAAANAGTRLFQWAAIAVERKGLGFDGRIFYISNMDGETATIIFGVTIDPRDETRKVLIAKDDALSRLGIAAAEAQKICQKFGSY